MLQRLVQAVLAVMVLTIVNSTARAEIDIDNPKRGTTDRGSSRAKVRKHSTTIIERDSDDYDEDHDDGDGDGNGEDEAYPESRRHQKEHEDARKEKTLNAKFGAVAAGAGVTAGCKTEELSQKSVKALKSDCNAWLKDRKAELKDKFVVGSCDESCEDCGMHLRRCSVDGTIRYR